MVDTQVLESKVRDLELLDELRRIAKRKVEIWDVAGFGLTWRADPLAQEYQELDDRVWEIKKELFGDYAIEI